MSEVTEKTYAVTLEKPTPQAKFGISFAKAEDGSVVVKNVDEKGLAATSALKEGDKIKSINGKDVSSMTAGETARMMSKAPSGPISIIASFDEEVGAEESSPLLLKEETIVIDDGKIAQSQSGMLGTVIFVVQCLAAIIISIYFDYGTVDEFTTEKYIIFRDIMVMLLLGFGYCKCDSMLP
jgi:membrane-associated protease RseP (regulator of RpoE activity)